MSDRTMTDSLEDRLDEKRSELEYATTWKPDEHGRRLIGTLEKMDRGPTKYGECEIAHIRAEGGALMAVWLFHTVLEREWEEAAPTPGDRVAIEYLGEREGQSYNYHAYAVVCERQREEDKAAREGEDEDPKPPTGEPFPPPDEGHDERPDPSLDDPNAELPY